MKEATLLIVCVAMIVVLGCSRAEPVAETELTIITEGSATGERHDLVYVCNCGPECDCGSISTNAGTCSCGSELAAAHVVKIDGHDAMLCTHGGDCTCEINADDDTKCTCPADVKRVSLEGKGLYFCNCGGACTCNFISDEPGNCTCGMELIS